MISKQTRKLQNEELNRISAEDFKKAEKTKACIILDNIRSLHNVGATFRTSDAFRLSKIYLCGITGKPPHREIQRAALGATDAVDWEYFEDITHLVISLRKQDWTIISVEQTEKSVLLQDFCPKKEKQYAFVFGNEVSGVQQEIVNQSDICLEIPQYGTKHSFNISVSVGIILWDFFSKQYPKGIE